jgi:hypothetical protein
VEADDEFDGEVSQSESKLNYAGTRDHPGDGYVDNDPPTLFDKREQRAEKTEHFVASVARRRGWWWFFPLGN